MGVWTVVVEARSGSKGKERLVKGEVEQFTDTVSAVDYFTERDDEGNTIRDGDEYVVERFNSLLRQVKRRSLRASLGPVSLNRLRDLAKQNSEVRSRFNLLLEELELPLFEG